MEFEYLFVFEVLTALIIGFSYSMLIEKIPEPGATVMLFILIALLFLLIEGARELGNVLNGTSTLIEVAPTLALKWTIGIFLALFPVFYAAGFRLPDIYFYITRTTVALLAWIMPFPYVLKIIGDEVVRGQGG